MNLVLRIGVTLATVAVAAVLGVLLWRYYMLAPWTRDARVRAYVLHLAPEVSGTVTGLPVADNQTVHKGDVLFTIDPRSYQFAAQEAAALLASKREDQVLKAAQASRRERLGDIAISEEDRQTYVSTAAQSAASSAQAEASLRAAQLNLERTVVRSPVNGYVTNLNLQVGDYVSPGQAAIAVLDSDSFWVAGYFEETKLPNIAVGAKAVIRLMGVKAALEGHVDSLSRGIADTNDVANSIGLQQTNPVFTWVRLAQRIPVRIAIDRVPPGVVVAAGQSATVTVGVK